MANRNIPLGIRVAVLDRDNYKCSFCGAMYNLTIDHIISVSKE